MELSTLLLERGALAAAALTTSRFRCNQVPSMLPATRTETEDERQDVARVVPCNPAAVAASSASLIASRSMLVTTEADKGIQTPTLASLVIPETLVEQVSFSRARRHSLLLIFCMAQFLGGTAVSDPPFMSAVVPDTGTDAVGTYRTIVALPYIERDLHLDQPTGTWVLNACTSVASLSSC